MNPSPRLDSRASITLTLVAAFLFPVLGAAQVPDTLLHSIPPPFGALSPGARLGSSVAIDGGLTVAGAPLDDVSYEESGAVKVFHSTTGTLLFVLRNPFPAGEEDRFGQSVAISGTRVVVGVPRKDTPAVEGGSAYVYEAGRAYVYDLGCATPTVPVATLNNPSPADNDYFGLSVAIYGTRVVVGAALDDPGVNNAGTAYIYDFASATPTVPVVTLNDPRPAVNEQFGRSVAISGPHVVIGVSGSSTGTPYGRAHVYNLTSATPTVPAVTLEDPSREKLNGFGASVAISGMRVVAGLLMTALARRMEAPLMSMISPAPRLPWPLQGWIIPAHSIMIALVNWWQSRGRVRW